MSTGYDKYVICGIPRTTVQSEGLVSSKVFENFYNKCVIDISVSNAVLCQRFQKRKVNENRSDDTLENFEERIRAFDGSRHKILQSFTHDEKWHVRCVNGDASDTAEKIVNHLIESMRLEPLPKKLLAQAS